MTSRHPESRGRRRVILGVTALGFLGFCVSRRCWLITNDVTTGATACYPELQSRVYASGMAKTRTAAAALAGGLNRWRVVRSDPPAADDTLHCEVTTMLFGFVDDLTVRFEKVGEEHTRVIIRSHSRVGSGDLGENARHIAALQQAMDRELPVFTDG